MSPTSQPADPVDDDLSGDLAGLLTWFSHARRDLPWREPSAGPWGVLVSEFMLQQTPVARVLPVYRTWMHRWPTPAALAAEPSGEAIRAWGRLGYPRRALRLHAAATSITETHAGRVPDDVEALLALPGVGTYTARAVACFAYGQRHAVIDTNVRRVVARWRQGRADAASMALGVVEALLPADDGVGTTAGTAPAAGAAPTAGAAPQISAAPTISAALMELGALVCTARTPRCDACPFRRSCRWRSAGYPPGEAKRRSQTYAGTDRQVRGAMLALLRQDARPRLRAELLTVCADAAQAERALAGLLADGLVQAGPDGTVALPR